MMKVILYYAVICFNILLAFIIYNYIIFNNKINYDLTVIVGNNIVCYAYLIFILFLFFPQNIEKFAYIKIIFLAFSILHVLWLTTDYHFCILYICFCVIRYNIHFLTYYILKKIYSCFKNTLFLIPIISFGLKINKNLTLNIRCEFIFILFKISYDSMKYYLFRKRYKWTGH